MKFLLKITLLIIPIAMTACSSEEIQKPDAQQQSSLKRLHKNCIAASPGKQGRFKNLAVLRKNKLHFTCDEMKLSCESNFVSEACEGMMLVASVQNAYQKICRSNNSSGSSACKKLAPCNLKGFASPGCVSAIARYNK